ncbi:YheU family protein [Alteromonas facilis]|uniref:YheU family protein n=1 Tax=Alteromonas facilis TaxID=2048004 RepID=UPI000C290C72|nr:YheU family protein [Alteromonas facilis]
MIIPIDELEPDTLRNIVESVVLREGTDYGEEEVDFNTKVEQVLEQLKVGDAMLQYSELHESVDIIKKG